MKGQLSADIEARVVPIIEHMAAHAPVGDETTIRGFELPANQGVTHLIASVSLETDPGLTLYYTLKTASEHIFLLVSDGDPTEMGIILSATESRDASGTGPLQLSNIVGFDRPYLSKRGIAGGLICEPACFDFLAPVTGDHGATVVTDTSCFLLLLLNDQDMAVVAREGAAQFLTRPEQAERDWHTIPAKR